MDILYLSSFCSDRESKRISDKFGTAISHALQKYSEMLVSGLEKNGAKVEMLSHIPYGKPHTLRFSETENGRVYNYTSTVSIPLLKRVWSAFSAKKVLNRWQREHSDGVILCDILSGELSLALKFSPRKCKRIGIVTDVPTLRAEEVSGIRKVTAAAKKKLSRSFDGYLLLTEKMNSVVNPQNKPHIVIEGFADAKMAEKENRAENKYQKRICMFAGLLDAVFGIDRLVKGFVKADIDNAELHIYGSGDWLEQLLRVSEKHPSVKYCGQAPNEEIVEEEQKSTLLINPRPSDRKYTQYSFPSKNIEYMASGTPLLCTALQCMPEEYYDYIYIIEDESSDGMANALKKTLALSDKELFEKGAAAKRFMLENKNNVMSAKKLLDFIEAV